MVDWHRVHNVIYYDYTPSTIEYHGELNAFEVARAEIYSGWHAHRLSLIVVATPAELGADRAAIEETIARSRPVLELLIAEHRVPADRLTASLRWIFNVIGERIH